MTHRGFFSEEPSRKFFDPNFVWGVSASAAQTEGAALLEGKGPSIWDEFSSRKGKIAGHDQLTNAADFYYRFQEDISILKQLKIPNFRFSISWPRVLPNGTGPTNQQGLDFYHRLIDHCLENQIVPWVTLYHWDLPQALENKGGWANRDILDWFEEFVLVCVNAFGGKVKNWMVLNEPMVFTGAGYFLGIHAPGRRGLKNFLQATHHAALCQSLGEKIIHDFNPELNVGSTFSCSAITPYSPSEADKNAALRIDALLNRLFIEPALGIGYPVQDLPFLDRIEKYMKPGDDQLLKANFDFIGIQNYTREVVTYSFLIPFLQARLIPASKRKVYHTRMDWEVYPESIYEMIKKFSAYPTVKNILITENGASFLDEPINGKVKDEERIHFLKSYLLQVQRAVGEGLPVTGYFIWSLTDNFEWTEGYRQRFGLVYVNFKTQQRTIKDSGFWYRDFLRG